MAQIIGQIDSLKQIRNHLYLKGIDRFNSIGEINTFLGNYESEKTSIYQYFKSELQNDINELKEQIKYNHILFERARNESIEKHKYDIDQNLNKIVHYNKKNNDSFLSKGFSWIIVKFLYMRLEFHRKNYERNVNKSTIKIEREINKGKEQLDDFISNKEYHVRERSANKIKQLAFTKDVVLELKPVIAGAIGENLVVKEIEKLSDDYILINDFSLKFDPPIYNREKNDRIFSIQIDHLLISKSGIYILETKNWSKKSIMSLEMRSPIDQIDRTGYALFTLLNGRNNRSNIKLDKHHWGKRKISIRSIVVMINKKPQDDFKYVKVKTLNELNSYIKFFEPIYNDNEFKAISDSLISLYYNNTPRVNTFN